MSTVTDARERPGAVQARLLGRLLGQLERLPRDEFGETYGLAVAAAYQRVESMLIAELERVAGT